MAIAIFRIRTNKIDQHMRIHNNITCQNELDQEASNAFSILKAIFVAIALALSA